MNNGRADGEFKHFCSNWNDMEINEAWPEFDCCPCEREGWDMEAKAKAKEKLRKNINIGGGIT